MKYLAILFTLAVTLRCEAFFLFGGGGSSASAYHADNLDNGSATNAAISGAFTVTSDLIAYPYQQTDGLQEIALIQNNGGTSLNFFGSDTNGNVMFRLQSKDGNFACAGFNFIVDKYGNTTAASYTGDGGGLWFSTAPQITNGDFSVFPSQQNDGLQKIAISQNNGGTSLNLWASDTNGNQTFRLQSKDGNFRCASGNFTVDLAGNATANSFTGSGSGLTGIPGSALPTSATQFGTNVLTAVTGGGVTTTTNTGGISVTLPANITNVMFWSPATYLQATSKTTVLSTNYFITLTAGVWRFESSCTLTNASATPGVQGGLITTNAVTGRATYHTYKFTGNGPGETTIGFFQPTIVSPQSFVWGGINLVGSNESLMWDSAPNLFMSMVSEGVFTLTNSTTFFWGVQQSWQGTADAAHAAVLWTNSYALFTRLL